MDHVVWAARPPLRQPVLIVAFEGWNDAGEAATVTARYLADHWDATPLATIDPEEFYDFTASRPEVALEAGRRTITWPTNQLLGAVVPGASLDALVFLGVEPQLRWRTFCQQIVDMARATDVSLVVLLGALLSDVPHTRPVSVVGTAEDEDLIDRLDLQPSRYEGPTGIIGVLHEALRGSGIPSVSLWAAVPTYVPSDPSPKAALALVERITELLAMPIDTTTLAIAAAAYERQINDLVDGDDETAAYVRRLEDAADDEDDDDGDDPFDVDTPFERADSGQLIEELERYLRDQPPGD